MTEDLQSLIVQYERQLHQAEIRSQQIAIEKLLHRHFFEIGRSGKRYGRQQVIDSLLAETDQQQIASEEFALTQIESGALLLTYRTFRQSPSGEKTHRTLRTSLWVRNEDDRWQMIFHQGTPEAD
ncbi:MULTISPECIES: DUF4440 domain-containing protein [Kosakonia]|uniref:DUF4440 domain-containing protein n=1 Tax=Kosakonia radicincitans TaxID=283686 RepID=A0AAX2EP14_9ENTR|nr:MULTISPECIES: nuclear transport factor 2 family protein [Kosakonia]MDP9567021.1 hypothetical protein [Kosakonia oryzae]MDD7998617.1 nuclear transport factor 2 family protein [Kosakonia radicincitans]NCF07642.1 nuclear transport factor 2 family protein [Kosakonia sp. MH5]PTA92610.1 nuclear transport factor 2 family protein [Kosakonia sp. H7A]SES91824.1 hypothetical protein SAMN03159294_1475 [Kosakonia radicincitans]